MLFSADSILFCSMAAAIVIEGIPFLLLGSLVGALFEAYVPQSFIERVFPKHPALQVVSGLFAGMLLPTCECGVVPVVRKLLTRGVPPRAAVAYLFAAPVINPIVIASTWVAFRFDTAMVAWRVGMVAATAGAIALSMGNGKAMDVLRLPSQTGIGASPEAPVPLHAEGCGCGHCHDGEKGVGAVLRNTGAEFLGMFRFLLLGAILAALFRMAVPPNAMQSLASNTPLSVASMMGFAIVSSVCSEADAFVAAGFATLPSAARLAFTVVGPMVDLKLIGMFFATFKKRISLAFIVLPIVCVYLMSVIFDTMGVLP